MTETSKSVSWVEETAQAVSLARNAGEAQRQAAFLSESETELKDFLAELGSLRDSAEVVKGLGWAGKSASPDLLRGLDEASQGLDSRSLKGIERLLDEYCRDTAEALKAFWTGHAASQLGDVTDLLQLSETLSDVDGVGEVSQRLSATLRVLSRAQDSLPTGESLELLSKAEELLQNLESALQPDGVRRFLSHVARGGAPVESLTPDVMKWLEDHGSVRRFKIVAGRSDEHADD